MIFVTAGTAGPFDELLQEVDRLDIVGLLAEEIICQRGQSKYRMQHGKQFVGRPPHN